MTQDELIARAEAVTAFLCGHTTLDGVDYGSRHPMREGAFWWRRDLHEATTNLIAALRAERKARERAEAALADTAQREDKAVLAEKMRMMAWCSKRAAISRAAWERASRKALAGDMAELRNRIALIDAGPMDIALSATDSSTPADAQSALNRIRQQAADEALERAASEMELAAHIMSHSGNAIEVRTYQNAAKNIRALKGGAK